MPPTKELMKKIDVIVTDMRASFWDRIPQKDQKQVDVEMKEVPIYGLKAYEAFHLMVRLKFDIKNKSNFVICRPDQDVTLDSHNISKLNDGDRLIILDSREQQVPFTYRQVMNTIPHTKTITDQDGTYYGNRDQNAAAFAVAELVDNALSATAHNDGNRTIEIRFHENGDKSSLHILDNGCGMNSDVLKSGLVFKAPKEVRRIAAKNFISHEDSFLSQTEDTADELLPMYINSNISKFGAGMKQAIFYLGQDVRILTKSSDSQNVSEVLYSKEDLEKKESTTNENPWDVTVYMGLPGEIRSPGTQDDKLVKELISEEIGKQSFTHIVISKIHHVPTEASDVSRLDLLKKKDSKGMSLERQLAHIYHYYIHGRDCYDGSDPQHGLVDLIVTRYAGDKLIGTTNLRNLGGGMENLEHMFIRTAEDTFKFSIEVSEYNTVGETFKVGGIIRYHPCKFDQETHPGGLVTRKAAAADIDDESSAPSVETGNGNGNGNGANIENAEDQELFDGMDRPSVTNSAYASASTSRQQSTRKISNFFHVWWNGRLIPNSKWDSFDWCSSPSPSSRLRLNDPIYKCYDRISGSLFFDKHMKSITCTKLEMTVKNQHLDMFNEKIGGQQATFQRIEVAANGQLRASRMLKSSKAFETWIRACHKKYDKQVTYSKCIGITTIKIDENPMKKYDIYQNAIWDVKLKTGNLVKLVGRGLNRVVGKIQSFLVEAAGENVVVDGNGIDTHAPLAYAKIQQLPEPLFGNDEDSIIYKCMSYIDKTVSAQQVERMIDERVNELQMKLVLEEWAGIQVTEGLEVPIDSPLIKLLKIHILRTLDNKPVPGCLFHPLGDKAAKKIYMVARLYRISDKEPELFYTSARCQYISTSRGYFFKDLNLKSMNVKEPGNYVIKFLSYVDVREDWMTLVTGTATTASRSRNSTASTSRASASAIQDSSIDADATALVRNTTQVVQVQDPDMDDIGRNTLRYGQKIIPMPKCEIKFKIVAGFPTKVVIQDVAEDEIAVKIGVPFNVRLFFLDDKGNRTKPSLLNSSLIPQDGNLLVVDPLKKSAKDNFGLTLTHKPPQLVDDLIVIPGVELHGLFGGDFNFRDCKMTARVQLKKLLTSGHPGPRFRVLPGIPKQLKVEEETVRVENGTSIGITCLVLDSSGNHVKYSNTDKETEDKKPIMLSCDIYKGKTVRSGKLFEGLKLLSATDKKIPQKIMDIVLDLDELKTGKMDQVQFLCKITSEEFGLETSVTLIVFPSKRPEKICISYKNPITRSILPINPGSQLQRRVNEHIADLTYRVYDGMGNTLDFDDTKYKFSFDWPCRVQQISKVRLDFGELPKMEIPNKILEDKEVRTIFSSIKRGDDAVELTHMFCLTTTPLKPVELRATGAEHSLGESLDILVDEPLSEDIILTLLDEHGNHVTDLDRNDLSVNDIEVETPEFDVTFETAVSAGSCLIRHLKFSPPPPVGKRELEIRFGMNMNLKTSVKLNFIHGKPVGLAFEIDNELIQQRSQSVVTVPNMYNANVRVLLIDSCRNIVGGVKRCIISLERHRRLIPGSVVNKVTVNSDGIADFKVIRIGLRADELSTPCKVKENPCPNKCFNISYMTATADWIGGSGNGNGSTSTITQARCNFHILCRPEIPTKLTVSSGQLNHFVYEAGGNFIGLTATLEAEDDSRIMTSRVQDLTLCLTNPITNTVVFSISPNFFQEGVFGFGGVPGKIGDYSVKFLFDNQSSTRFEQILREESLKIIASAVDCLEPEDFDGAPTVFVSNDPNDRTRRTITSNLKLYLKDEHKNLILESLNLNPDSIDLNDVNGSVKMCLSGGLTFDIFENSDVFSKPIPMKNAVVEIPDIILLPEADLPNNSKYTINFATALKNESVFEFSLHFTFFNDISQQQERVELENQRGGLVSTIKTKEDQLEIYEQELDRLTTEVRQLKQIEEVERQTMKWRERRIQTETLDEIIMRENSLEAKKRSIQKNRRDTGCNIERFQCTETEATHILGPGPIGQLAQIKSDGGAGGGGLKTQLEIQRMLSWHLKEYLPIIVARNAERGKELEEKYDSKIFMFSNLPRADIKCWKTPIPTKFSTPQYGNPIHARQLLKMTVGNTEDIKICQKVFMLTLGHTIIVNTFDNATKLMEDWNNGPGALSEITSCPTILSRDGHRLSHIGISTKAPPLDCLSFKFGLAQSDELNLNEEEIKRLAILKSMVKDRMEANTRVEEYVKTHDTRVTKLRQELEECRNEETIIVNKLGCLDEAQGQRLKSPEGAPAHTRAHHRGNTESLRTSARIRKSNVTTEPTPTSDAPTSSKRARKS